MGARPRRSRRTLALLFASFMVVPMMMSLAFLLLPRISSQETASAAAARETDKTVSFKIKILGTLNNDTSGDELADSAQADLVDLMQRNPVIVREDRRAEADSGKPGPDKETLNYNFEGRYNNSFNKLSGSVTSLMRVNALSIGPKKGYCINNQTFKGELELEVTEGKNMTGTLTGVQETWRTYEDGDTDSRFTKNVNQRLSAQVEDGAKDTGTKDDDEKTGDKDGTEKTGDEDHHAGGKVPGPGSWPQWIFGTTVAGAIAAGLGLLGGLPGSAPPPVTIAGPEVQPRRPTDDAPQEDGAAYMGSAGYYGDIFRDFLKNTFNDVKRMPGQVYDKGKWVYNGVTDPDNWRDAVDRIQNWNHDILTGQKELVSDMVKDPAGTIDKGLMGASDIAVGVTEAIKNNPLGVIKDILTVDWWKNAMDPNRPIIERLGYSTLAGLNAIGLIESAAGISKWFTGGAGAGLLDDGVRGVGLADDLPRGAGAGERPPRVPMLEPRGNVFHELTTAQETHFNHLWNNNLQEAKSNVKHMKNALNKGNVQDRIDAVVRVQRDPLSKNNLNGRTRQTIKKFKKQLAGLQNTAMDDTIAQISERTGINRNRIRVFRGTNPRRPGSRIRVSMDQDFTIEIVDENGTVVDFPARDAQGIYDNNFYRAAGSPRGVTPAELGESCGNIAVDQHSAESLTFTKEGDFDNLMAGEATSHPETVGDSLRYKSDEPFMRADELARNGHITEAMKERWMGQRETVKAFRNQVEGRLDYLERHPGTVRTPGLDSKIANVRDTIDQMEKMVKEGASPVRIDNFLRSRNTTAEDLAKQVSEIYKVLGS